MLRRILAVVVAFFLTLLLFVAYRFICIANIPFQFGTRLVLSAILLGIAVYLVRRRPRWPALLLLVGLVPIFVIHLHEFIIIHLVRQDFAEHHSFLFPVAQENTAILTWLYYMQFLSLCAPIALFWYLLQVAQRHLTNRCS